MSKKDPFKILKELTPEQVSECVSKDFQCAGQIIADIVEKHDLDGVAHLKVYNAVKNLLIRASLLGLITKATIEGNQMYARKTDV